MTTWACYPHGTRIEQDEKPTFDCSDADRSSCWWEKVTPQPKEQHAHNMHILGLIRDEPAWALSRILHHVNGDKTDNRLENLQVVSASHHRIIHTSGISDARVAELLREGRKTREIIALGVGAQRIVRVRREMAS